MKLREFIMTTQANVIRFQFYWEKNQREEGFEAWLEEMTEQEWSEQLIAFLGQVPTLKDISIF